MIADRLRQSVLEAAISGKLTEQRPEDGTAAELLALIADERMAQFKGGKLKKQKELPEVDDVQQVANIPSSWKWARLGTLVELIRGVTFPGANKNKTEVPGTVQCLTTGSVQREYNANADVFIEPSFVKNNKQWLESGDIVISSANSAALVGKSIIWNAGLRCTFGGFLTVARASKSMDPRYLQAVLSLLQASGKLNDASTQTTNIANLSNATLNLIAVPVPPLAEQERIVKRLDEILPLIDQLAELERERESLDDQFVKALERAILQAAVSGHLTTQTEADGTAQALLDVIESTDADAIGSRGKRKASAKDAPKPVTDAEKRFTIPANWVWTRLGVIGNWKSGSTPNRAKPEYYLKGTIPWVKSGEVKQGRISDIEESITEQALKDGSFRLNPKNSVLVAMYGANIGDVGILQTEAVTNQAVCACITHRGIEPAYVETTVKALKDYFIDLGAGGAQPNISREKIIAAPVPLPPTPEQERIAAKVDTLLPLVASLKNL